MTDQKIAVTKEYDIYRDSLLRYLGYSNELGESFRPLIKKSYVHASYAVAVSYVFADTADKCIKSYEKDKSLVKAAKIGGDVVIWQLLASVIIPGFTINRICWAVGKGLKMSKFRHPLAKWIPTITGLLSIPLIIHPIDHAVDVLMDESYRKYVK